MAVAETQNDPQALWRKSGARPDRPARGAPDLTIVLRTPAVPPAEMEAGKGRPPVVRSGRHLRGIFDRLIASGSLVSNDPVLDLRDFAWTAALRANWQAIREEAIAVALRGKAAPRFGTISADHRAVAEVDKCNSVFLWRYGHAIEENIARCPRTASVVRGIPGLSSAVFSILAPGTHVPAHRGVTKGLITCHLGLIVPADGDVRMRVGDRVVRWAEGETLVFDDTYDHEVWNDTAGTRVVLLIQFERPLRQPGKWFADLFIGFVRRSALAQGARDDIRK